MSRIGKKPIEIPDGVNVDVSLSEVPVKGPKGELTQALITDMKVSWTTAPSRRAPDRPR